MRQGSVNISKARFLSGGIGHHQYDLGMKATSVLEWNESDKKYELCKLPPGKRDRLVSETKQIDFGSQMLAEFRSSEGNAPEPQGSEDKVTEKIEKNKEDSEVEEEDLPNPLKWFGYLPPQALRQAQSQYQEALKLVISMSNSQLRFKELALKLDVLLEQKKELSLKDPEK